MVKSHRQPHLPHPYDDISMKRTMSQSGIFGALSGGFGGLVACTLGIFMVFFFVCWPPSCSIGDDWPLIFSDYVFDGPTVLYIWLPGIVSGSLVGLISGKQVITRPDLLARNRIWLLRGGLTSVGMFLIAAGILGFLNEVTIFMAVICGMIGGLVARFVYGMLQRRSLPELQMN